MDRWNKTLPTNLAVRRPDYCRFVVYCMVVASMGPLVLLIGCRRPIDTDAEIQRLATRWPPYQTPGPADTTTSAIWTPVRPTQRRGPQPLLDNRLPSLKSYREWNLEETALDSLARIGAPAVPELIKALEHPEARIRLQAAEVIGRIGPVAEEAVSALVYTVSVERSEDVRKAAVRALGQIGPKAEEAVEPLMRMIDGATNSTPSM